MKKTLIKLASALLAAAVCLPSAGVSAVSLRHTMVKASGNTDFAVRTAALVRESEHGGAKGNASQSLDDGLRIIGRAKNGKYDFSQLGFDEGVINTDNRFILTFSDSEKMKKALERLENDENILYAARDGVIFTQELIVEDGEYMSWGVDALGMGDYADFLADSAIGGSVTVAIVDSGVADVGIISDKLTGGYDFVSNDTDATDDTSSNSHGTFLGSIIADSTKALPVDIMPVRVLSSNSGSLSNAVNGIIYAADNGADIINVSLGGVFSSCEILDDAVNYADSKGASVVVCAGNSKMDTKTYCPAHNKSAVTVSSVGQGLEFSESFSNFGAEVDCCAPGELITGLSADGSETVMSGTSMSAAFVSAGAAMLKLGNPSCNPAQIQQAVKDICGDLGKKGFDNYYGWGIPDFSRLVTEEVVPALHTVTWVIGGFTLRQELRTGEKVTEPELSAERSENFSCWDIPVPETMPDEDITIYAVFDYTVLKIKNAPDSGILTVDYRSSVVFHAEGAVNVIEWFVNGEPANIDPDGGCTVTDAREDYEIYCRGADSEGRTFKSKKESVKVRKGFFDRLKAFLRWIFGKLPVIYQ